MKKGIIKAFTAAACAVTIFGGAVGMGACGNMDVLDMHYEFHYVVIEENGEHILHEVKSWADSDSESVTFSTECCHNYIWTSANNSTLYEYKPPETAYDRVCGQGK